MNILILGSGGREHALAWKMAASPLTTKLYCAPGNAGIAQEAECVALDIADHKPVIAFCQANKIDFVVVGPEAPLCAGIVDDLEKAGIKTFGPSKWAARLEGSKGFTKDLCKANKIPTAAYERFKGAAAAKDYVQQKRRADRGQGRRTCRRQGRRGGGNGRRGRSRHRHDVFRRAGRARLGDRDRGLPRRRGSLVLRAVRRRDGDPAGLGAGPQARLRRRQGAEHRRHGRLFAGADHDRGDEPARDGRDHHADGARA